MSDAIPEVLAFDLGSSGVRAVVFDAALRPTAAVRRPTALWQDATGAATLNPDEYVEATAACLDELQHAGALAGVRTVAASCQWHSLIPLDAEHRPVGPGLSWMDTRAIPPKDRAPADPAAFHQRTGAWWHGLYWPARIAWLRSQGTDAQRWCGLAEYLAFRLLGEASAGVSAASGTGALDTTTCRWDPEALALAGVDETRIPTIAPDEFRGRLRPEYAHRWPDLSRADWALPIGDGAASAIGSGCDGPDRLSVTVGTSAAVRLVRPGTPEVPYRVWRYRIDHTRNVLGVAYSGGGVLYEWIAGVVDPEPTESQLSALAPGQHGLVVLPFHAGHRPPLPAGAAGTIHGLRLSTTALDMVAATLEAICHELADGARALDPADHAEAILGGGSVSASPWFARRLAASFGGRALLTPHREIGAVGAAMLATGRVPHADPEPIETPPAEVAAMAEAWQRYCRLRDLLVTRMMTT